MLGLLSLIFWSLTMAVTVKYMSFIMRANKRNAVAADRHFLIPPKQVIEIGIQLDL